MSKMAYLQILHLIFIALTQSFRLSSRKTSSPHSYDPFIICEMEGPSHSEGLPLAYNEQVYAELLTLCSSAHGARENVGCFCSTDGGQVHCDHNLADDALWTADYNPEVREVLRHFEDLGFARGHVDFPQLCQNGCDCVPPRDADAWFAARFDGDDWNALVGIEGLQKPPNQPAASGNTFGAGSLIGNGQSSNGDQRGGQQHQCGKNCSSAQDCSAFQAVGQESGDGTCTCQAHSSQYQPQSSTVAFLATCLTMLGSGGGGKREEQLPCPCNSTYVSHSCCESPDGIVWEPSSMKLGFLAV